MRRCVERNGLAFRLGAGSLTGRNCDGQWRLPHALREMPSEIDSSVHHPRRGRLRIADHERGKHRFIPVALTRRQNEGAILRHAPPRRQVVRLDAKTRSHCVDRRLRRRVSATSSAFTSSGQRRCPGSLRGWVRVSEPASFGLRTEGCPNLDKDFDVRRNFRHSAKFRACEAVPRDELIDDTDRAFTSHFRSAARFSCFGKDASQMILTQVRLPRARPMSCSSMIGDRTGSPKASDAT